MSCPNYYPRRLGKLGVRKKKTPTLGCSGPYTFLSMDNGQRLFIITNGFTLIPRVLYKKPRVVKKGARPIIFLLGYKVAAFFGKIKRQARKGPPYIYISIFYNIEQDKALGIAKWPNEGKICSC
jgi:hypothetical protein